MDWATIASLATAAGTLVLAVATFMSIRSANRSARVAERALLAGMRPVLAPSRREDPVEKIFFGDNHWLTVAGGHAGAEAIDQAVYLGIPLRNVGTGIAVLHGWYAHDAHLVGDFDHPDPADFRRLTRDLFVSSGDVGFWQGALRDPAEAPHAGVRNAVVERRGFTVDILYGDHEGGQRAISRFGLIPVGTDDWVANVARYWSLDRPGPRQSGELVSEAQARRHPPRARRRRIP